MAFILGIETSCDETAAAVVEDGVRVRSNVIATQHHLHEKYGGVVPEIASRAHLERLTPVLAEAVAQAGVQWDQLDAIAVGNRPGLIGSLLVGVSAAKALAWALNKPLIGVDHVQAHLHAGFLQEGADPHPNPLPGGEGMKKADPHPGPLPGGEGMKNADPHPGPLPGGEGMKPSLFPALGLVVSGGHTSMYVLQGPGKLERLGRTIDDAVGEAYDKAAVILGLPYPGGPNVDKLAREGDGKGRELPQSLLGPGNLDFSFSGLKTALLYAVRGVPQGRGEKSAFVRSHGDLSREERANLAAGFQAAAIGILVTKMKRALARMREEGRPARALIVGGGVSANSYLRERFRELGEKQRLPVVLPPLAYCMDNAAMIAGLAHTRWQTGQTDDLFLPVLATGYE